MPSTAIDFSQFAMTKIAVFVHDEAMRRHTLITLKHLGFENVVDNAVPKNYFQALGRVVPIIASNNDLVLINLPSRPRPNAQMGDVNPIFDEIQTMYSDIKNHLAKRASDPLKPLAKTVPLIEVGDYLREKLIEVLFKFRVPAAFFMSALPSTKGMQGPRKDRQARENLATHLEELTEYLTQYFREKDEMVARVDEKLSERELSEKKKKYDELMDQAEEFKKRADYDKAITLLRQAIEVYPKDIDAYLESGRLHVRRREYGKALSRFGQAEDLFQEAPAPNKEIGNVRLLQVKEKIEAGEDPNGPEIKELLAEAAASFEEAHEKAEDMVKKHQGDPDFEAPLAVGNEIIKWNLTDILGAKHPAIRDFMKIAQKSTEGLDQLPVDALSTSQCLALALQAIEERDFKRAMKYYFRAIRDKRSFTEVCTEINYAGIRLRTMGMTDEAIKIYIRLLKYNPHNQGSVYWNMAIAYAHKDDAMSAAGFAARCLYTDPYMARQKEFYDSMSPKIAPVMMALLRKLKLVVVQQKKIKQPPQLVKMFEYRDRMLQLIADGGRGEAMKILMMLLAKARKFTMKPEFYGDKSIIGFVAGMRKALIEKNDPRHAGTINLLTNYLKWVKAHPVPPKLVKFLELCQAAVEVLEAEGDQHQAAFYLSQGLLISPDQYFARPDFFSRENLPHLARELASKFSYVDTRQFPGAKRK